MKYIVCEKPGEFILKEKEEPKRAEGEALLQVNKVGICGTDIHAFLGNQAFFTYPRILGHELATQVVEIDENEMGIKNGDKVVVMPYKSCGTCVACRNGKTNCCTNIKVFGVHIDGGMQEKITLPVNMLLPAGDLTDNEIAIVEPLAIGAHAIRRSGIKAGDTAVVIGCGPIGLGLMKLIQLKGAEVIAVDVNDDRLKFAAEKLGVKHLVNAKEDAVAQISEITNGDLAGIVFDASGNKFAIEAGPSYMSHGGTFVIVGLSKGDLVYSHPQIHAKETTLMCSRNATTEDFKYVMDILHDFPTEAFVTHSADYNEMIAKFPDWTDPDFGVVKAVVEFN